MERSRKRPPAPVTARAVIETPLGPILLFFSDQGLQMLAFTGEKEQEQEASPVRTATTPALPGEVLKTWQDQVARALEDFFAGRPVNTGALPLDLRGSPFLLKVWRELQKIPYGQTISYKELATRVGSPKGFRAVGQANSRNPIPILIPCHRVIAADGSLGGYSSGLDRKEWLLRHEKAI